MHPEARHFMEFVRSHMPNFFKESMVLDVGSGDINGNNRYLFDKSCHYIGNDVAAGANVDVVCRTSALSFPDETFGTIVSTECFEHDPEWDQSLKKIVALLKPGGLFAFTCASTGRGEHGTRRTSPENSFGSKGGVETWQDHYRNLDTNDLEKTIPLADNFSQFAAYYNAKMKDLYFWGIKKGGETPPQIPPIYTASACTQTA